VTRQRLPVEAHEALFTKVLSIAQEKGLQMLRVNVGLALFGQRGCGSSGMPKLFLTQLLAAVAACYALSTGAAADPPLRTDDPASGKECAPGSQGGGTTPASQANANSPPPSQPAGPSAFDDKMTGGWGGERQRLEQAGISLNAQLVLEGFENFQGGVRRGGTYASTFDLNLALDTEKVFRWSGGKFYVDLEDHAGQNPSTRLTGDLQVFDKLNSGPYLQIFEMWYQQRLFDDALRVKVGKVDANTEFSVIDNALTLLSSSTQVTPTILAFPTTPDPMPSLSLFFTPGKVWYASVGAFYANRSDTLGDIAGHPESLQPTNGGTFLIGESGLRWQHAPLLGADGNVKLGAWEHTGTFTRLKGGRENGAAGCYGMVNQTVWQPAEKSEQSRGLRTFAEIGRTQSSVSSIDWNVSSGVTWTGPLAIRPDDVLGFSANYAHISPEAELPHSYELALELCYQVALTKWATLSPDLQYIVHPGGQYSDALVGTLQLTLTF
jgi:porin